MLYNRIALYMWAVFVLLRPTLASTDCPYSHDFLRPYHAGGWALQSAADEGYFTPTWPTAWRWDSHWPSRVLQSGQSSSVHPYTTYNQYVKTFDWLRRNCDSDFQQRIRRAEEDIQGLEHTIAQNKSLGLSTEWREQRLRQLQEYLPTLRARWSITIGAISRAHQASASALLHLYDDCAKRHGNASAHYQVSLIHTAFGQADRAVKELREWLIADEFVGGVEDKAGYCLPIAEGLVEGGFYDDAVELLSDILEMESENVDARLLRAVSYFELGEYDLAAQDFSRIDPVDAHVGTVVPEGFVEAFLLSLPAATTEGLVDFIPSLFQSVRGIGRCLWAVAGSPIESSTWFAAGAYHVATYLAVYMSTLDEATLASCASELVMLCENFYEMSPHEKGELFGHIIGKYGTDMLLGGAAVKGVKALQELKKLNRVCNLEALVMSEVSKAEVVAQSIRHEAERRAFFGRAKIHWDKQGKHMPGHHNYIEGRSVVTVSETKLESLLSEKAGTGKWLRGIEPGEIGFKERIDFGEVIGKYVQVTAEGAIVSTAETTAGTVHYSKTGLHLVPAKPIGG